MKQPLVSVVVPAFNRAYCLERTIESALRQTYGNVEVLIVDDGSTDETAALVERRYGDDSRVRYLHQSNQGVAAARNTGLAAVRGEYIALLDSDDIWYPWKLTLQVAVFERFPDVGMVWTDMEAIDAAGNVTQPKYLRTMYAAYQWFPPGELFPESYPLRDIVPQVQSLDPNTTVSCGDIFSQMVMGNLVHTSTVLLRRRRLEAVAGFDPALTPVGEDYDFHLRTCREGPVAFIDISSIQYQRDFDDQLTQPDYDLAFARSHLSVITRTLKEDRERVRLSPSMMSACLADAHAWIGEAAMECGETGLARRHLFQSLRHSPWQPRVGLLSASCCLPRSMSDRLRSRYRQFKRLLHHRSVWSWGRVPIGRATKPFGKLEACPTTRAAKRPPSGFLQSSASSAELEEPRLTVSPEAGVAR